MSLVVKTNYIVYFYYYYYTNYFKAAYMVSVSTGAPPAYSPPPECQAANQLPQQPVTSDEDYHY